MLIRAIPPAKIADWNSVAHMHSEKPERHRRGVFVHRSLRPDEIIYRYMPARRALTIARRGKLWLNKVSSWDDPYEAWWNNFLFREDGPLEGILAYGSCWTRRKMDEPYWRLYSDRCSRKHPPSDPPVRIESTVGRLTDALVNSVNHARAKIFLGKVQYCTESALKKHMNSLDTNPAELEREAAHALLFKRSHFTFESEIRVIYTHRDYRLTRASHDGQRYSLTDDKILLERSVFKSTFPASDHLEIPFNIGDVITGVMIGPVVEDRIPRAKLLQEKLKKVGFENVRRSKIYAPVRR